MNVCLGHLVQLELKSESVLCSVTHHEHPLIGFALPWDF